MNAVYRRCAATFAAHHEEATTAHRQLGKRVLASMNIETQPTEPTPFRGENDRTLGLLTPDLIYIKTLANRAGLMAAILDGEGVAIFEPVVRATEKGMLPLGYKIHCVRTVHEARTFIKSAVNRAVSTERRRDNGPGEQPFHLPAVGAEWKTRAGTAIR
jgi:hypothetical protein